MFDHLRPIINFVVVINNLTPISVRFVAYHDNCVSAWGTIYWVGIKGDLGTGQWLDAGTGTPYQGYENLAESYSVPKEGLQCASVGGRDFPYDWFSTSCEMEVRTDKRLAISIE